MKNKDERQRVDADDVDPTIFLTWCVPDRAMLNPLVQSLFRYVIAIKD